MGDHLSRPAVTRRLERRTRFLGGPRQRNLLRLAPDGVWQAAVSPRRWWALTPPFHPYPRSSRGRSPFCATFHRLSPSGVSPASCPAVSGLSSDARRRPRSPGLRRLRYRVRRSEDRTRTGVRELRAQPGSRDRGGEMAAQGGLHRGRVEGAPAGRDGFGHARLDRPPRLHGQLRRGQCDRQAARRALVRAPASSSVSSPGPTRAGSDVVASPTEVAAGHDRRAPRRSRDARGRRRRTSSRPTAGSCSTSPTAVAEAKGGVEEHGDGGDRAASAEALAGWLA